MKKRQRLKAQLVTALEIPRALACRETIVTFTGRNQAVIENYRSILRYTREEIVVLTFRGRITISGKRLEIPWYTSDEMMLTGVISGMNLEQ